MKAEIREDGNIYLTIESTDKKLFDRHFGGGYMSSSKVNFIKPFVDKYGNPTSEVYMKIKGKEIDYEETIPSV